MHSKVNNEEIKVGKLNIPTFLVNKKIMFENSEKNNKTMLNYKIY